MVAALAVVPRVVLPAVALAVVPQADQLAACMARQWVATVTLPTALTPARAAMAEPSCVVPAAA